MSYITTYTRKHFDPVHPNPENICIQDIAHALSMLCRGNGHVSSFWSVGEHCICCAKEALGRGYSRRLVLACLLHDASECYMSDVPRPLKQDMARYREVEKRLLQVIYEKFLGSSLTKEEERLLKEIDDDLLWYDLEILLEEKQPANSSNYRVYMNNIEKQSELVAYIKTLDNVREVNQSEQAAKTLGSINRVVSYVSVAVIVILLIIAIFLISNTISVGITVRKDEIGIMKYIGATDGFVRAPFLLEGMVLGLVGAAIPLVILYFCYNSVVTYVYTKFSVLMGVVDFIPVGQIYQTLVPIALALGLGIGLVGSFITSRKHLKV